MAGDIAAQVLRDNYLQGEALSVAEARGRSALDRQARLIRDLEKSGRLDRALEFLPDDETLADRAAHRRGLARRNSRCCSLIRRWRSTRNFSPPTYPMQPSCRRSFTSYFPARLQERLGPQIPTHPLRREITATIVTNNLVNRAGIT